MDKFEELKNNIGKKVSDCKKLVEQLQKEITNADLNDAEKMYAISEEFISCCFEYQYMDHTLSSLITKEKEIREMLNGFYDIGSSLHSFVYKPIHKVPCDSFQYKCKDFRYKVEGEFFTTIEGAKAYSVSLGESEDWIDYVYRYINMGMYEE